MTRFYFLITLLFSALQLQSQELPPVVNFGPNQYSGGNQNWMIAQAENKNLYFANSTGLLEYNGEKWKLYPVPNNTIVRSLKVVGDRIYTGAYMEVGFWEPNDFGELVYTSLVPKFENINDGEQFWDIEFLDDLVIFRSFAGIYFYDPGENKLAMQPNPAGKPISGIFKFNDELYFQLVGEGFYKIENGKPRMVIPYSEIGDRAVMHLYQKNEKGFSIITGNSEFFKWNGKELIQFQRNLSEQLGRPNALDAIDLSNGDIVLGTVGKGIVQIGMNGEMVNVFNQDNILLNNTVLDLFLDNFGNVWAGLDYGISIIDLSSTFKSFKDNRGEIGSVYDSYRKGNLLYLATNQGLYLKRTNEAGFELIQGTNGQVWFIDEIDGKIFCGHNNGTYLIEGTTAIKVADRLGTWVVKKYTDDLFIQGHYNGISFLKQKNGKLEALPMLENFQHSSKFIIVEEDLEVWVGNEHKGVFRMTLNDALTEAVKIKNYKFDNESGITSSIFKYHDTLYYSSVNNVLKFQEKEDNFSGQNRLNTLLEDVDRVSGKLIVEDNSILWGFAEEGIFSIEPAGLSDDYEMNFIYIDQAFRNIAIGYENIENLGNSEHLLGVANGYIFFDRNKTVGNFEDVEVTIDGIAISAVDSTSVPVNRFQEGEFKYSNNNIAFSYSAPLHEKFLNTSYSYRLIGQSNNWSDWSASPEVTFKNLAFGSYIFEVKAKVGDHITNIASYSFVVERPFYLSIPAIVGYILIFLLILFAMHLLNRRHHRRNLAQNERDLKMKNLESEQEIIKLQNERLEQDMANKNRELAVSTMSLIKKNEFLTSIKDKLKDSEDSSQVKSVIKTIDKDISEEDNWKFFKKAFSNADKDFFQKVKDKHPELTSNDLKLCAYLRLNLSSKEIAPLLNISVKSVEIKRYRLRKKMKLDRETNLTEYILAL